MVSFPNAKINIGLQIVNKREDGFHNLQTIFYPIDLKDIIEIIPLTDSLSNELQFSQSGLEIDGIQQENLCIKAYQLLKLDYPSLPNIKFHIHKNIPIGAGLGGGSSDAASMLQLINEKFELNISAKQLIAYSLQLGSDCPFFIINKPCFASGRGELLEEISIDLSMYKILIVNPGIHINTGKAFKEVTISANHAPLKEIIQLPVEEWKGIIKNDFEEYVFNNYPSIKEIKSNLYLAGASFSLMSGSGSTVYGIFKKEIHPELLFPEGYFHKWL